MPRLRKVAVVLVVALGFGVTLLDDIAAKAMSSDADRQLAKSGVLVLSDFPSGWRAQPHSGSDDDIETIAKSIPSCKGYLSIRRSVHKNPRQRSQDFVQGDTQISNTVNVFASDRAAHQALAGVAKPSTVKCLRLLFEKAVNASVAKDPKARDQIESVDVKVGRLSVAPVGDEVLGFEAAIAVHIKGGVSQAFVADAEFVRVGRAIDAFSVQATSDLPTDLVAGLVDASVGRLDAAAA